MGVNPEATVAGLLTVALLGFLAAVSRGLLVPRSHVTDTQVAAEKRAAFAEATAEKRIAETRDDRDERIANTLAATESRIAQTLADTEARIMEALAVSQSRLADAYGQRDDWREAFRANDARADTLSAQLEQLTEASRTTVSVLEALNRAAGIERRQ